MRIPVGGTRGARLRIGVAKEYRWATIVRGISGSAGFFLSVGATERWGFSDFALHKDDTDENTDSSTGLGGWGSGLIAGVGDSLSNSNAFPFPLSAVVIVGCRASRVTKESRARKIYCFLDKSLMSRLNRDDGGSNLSIPPTGKASTELVAKMRARRKA
jgi:hypothetical protein